jgi:hypothetical protein
MQRHVLADHARMPRRRSPGASNMIEMRRAQRSFGDGLIAEEVADLREDWMRHADQTYFMDRVLCT